MTRARELLCPNCGGPLPAAPGQARVECTYCGRPVLLETRPPNAPPASHVPYAVVRPVPQTVSRAPFFVTVIVLGIGIGAAVLIYTAINRQVEQQHEARRSVQRQVDETLRSVGLAQDDAFAEMERALERVPAEIETAELVRRAEEMARQAEELARSRAERPPPAPRKPPAPKKPAPPPLPEAVELASVERAVARLDVSHCPGPGFIVYTFRVDAAGALKTVSQGPMRISGGSFGCVRKVVDEAKKTLTFPRTQNGSGTVQRRFELPE